MYKTQSGLALTNSLTVQRFSFRTHEISDRKDRIRDGNNVHAYLAVPSYCRFTLRECVVYRCGHAPRKKKAYNDNRQGGKEKIRQFAILTSVLNIVAALFPAESTTVVKRSLLPPMVVKSALNRVLI